MHIVIVILAWLFVVIHCIAYICVNIVYSYNKVIVVMYVVSCTLTWENGF